MINPSLNRYQEVNDFFSSLLPGYFVNYFAVGRVYRDGRIYNISSNPYWLFEHMILNNYPPSGLVNFDEIEGTRHLFECENYDQMLGWAEGAYRIGREKFNIKNMMTKMDKKKDFIDQYIIDIQHNDAVDIYLNRPGYIDEIFGVIKDKFHDLFDLLERHPLLFDVHDKSLQKLNINKSKGKELSLRHNGKMIALSSQEYRCLEGLAKGKKTKEIATDLQITCKTVETYKDRIKAKLNLHSTSSLIKCYWDNELMR